MKKTIITIMLISQLLAAAMSSVNAVKNNEETTEGSFHAIKMPYVNAYPFANVYVDDDNAAGPWNGTYEHPYQTIQDGINNADNSDIVYVFNGTYNENVVINKSITLRGESNESTVITDTVKIEVDHVIFSKFKITNVEGHGIISLSNYNTIEKNIITEITENYYETCTGIYSRGDFNTIRYNILANVTQNSCCSYSNGFGIESAGDFNTIRGNIISNVKSGGASTGIYSSGSFNAIEDNNLTNLISTPGWAQGIELFTSSNTTIKGNTIDKSNIG